jgi:hypothetical protein
MGTLIVVDCEAPFGVGSPSVGDMTEFGAVDVNALRQGHEETFHGLDCTEETFRRFREWLEPRKPVVFVSDNPAYDFQWINFRSGATSERTRSDIREGASPTSTRDWSVISEAPQRWKRLRRTKHDHHPVHDALGNAEALIRLFDGER